MEQLKIKIKNYISKEGNTHILIHSDVLFGFKIKFENHTQFLENHCNELLEICYPLEIIMPSFNYDFCKIKKYNTNSDFSQVGTLSEHFRKYKSSWRDLTPVFNFSGTGVNPLSNFNNPIDPFDHSSMFAHLYKNKDLLMHYGSGFHTTTLIHFAERISDKLIYRYDKLFNGQVIDSNNKKHNTSLLYHVRPLELPLDYDWLKIENDLYNSNILTQLKKGRSQITLGRIDKIVDFWLEKLDHDPFYLLNEETLNWVKNKYNKLKRPFIITDFE